MAWTKGAQRGLSSAERAASKSSRAQRQRSKTAATWACKVDQAQSCRKARTLASRSMAQSAKQPGNTALTRGVPVFLLKPKPSKKRYSQQVKQAICTTILEDSAAAYSLWSRTKPPQYRSYELSRIAVQRSFFMRAQQYSHRPQQCIQLDNSYCGQLESVHRRNFKWSLPLPV